MISFLALQIAIHSSDPKTSTQNLQKATAIQDPHVFGGRWAWDPRGALEMSELNMEILFQER